jgi:hypothetical protein
MGFASFLSSLFESGRVRVTGQRELPEDELHAGDEVLRTFELLYRLELPGEPPALDPKAARWAAVLFFRACQFALYRDVPASIIEEELSARAPFRASPSVCYSVDLVFRLLPDLARFARSAAENDPLVGHLERLGREWPLSSVGMPDLGAVDVRAFIDDPCLLALYVDRILAARDVSRLSDARVRDSVAQALGLHPELSPALADALKQHELREPA